MNNHSTITTATNAGDSSVTFLLNGKFGEESVAMLEQSIGEARQANRQIYIDLSEVTLVDRTLLHYISTQREQGVTLVNCPIYLRRWIAGAP